MIVTIADISNMIVTIVDISYRIVTIADVSDMKVTILEKVHSLDPLVRKEREELYIRKFNTKYKGLNKK